VGRNGRSCAAVLCRAMLCMQCCAVLCSADTPVHAYQRRGDLARSGEETKRGGERVFSLRDMHF
jgi:hypothetical protein